jgi:predicted dehydrogenase
MSSIRWGLIGCGDVVRKRVARAIKDEPRSRLIAACRRDADELIRFCESFGVERAYASSDDLLADGDVDAVYIATPVCFHLPQTLAAARAGKHVLVEKPMAMSVAECEQMIDACRQAGVKLSVAYYRRFYPLVRRVHELISEGEIGRPLAVTAITATHPATNSSQEGFWRVVLGDGGGGALMDIGSHRIDVFQYLFGPIADVKAYCERVVADYEAEDSAVLIFRFDNGLVGTLQCHFGSSHDPDEFTVLGTEGRLVVRPLNGDTVTIESKGWRRSEKHPPADNLCGPLVADFASAILDDRDPTVSGEEGLAVNQIMERAYVEAQNSGG